MLVNAWEHEDRPRKGFVIMQDEVETVARHCRHTDCVYRQSIDGGSTPICGYILVENESRKCKISECDKYRQGEKVQPRINTEFILFWEYDFYDEDADIIW